MKASTSRPVKRNFPFASILADRYIVVKRRRIVDAFASKRIGGPYRPVWRRLTPE
jgi:hypothetical protein